MAGEIGVVVGYSGYVKVDSVTHEFGYWKIDPKYGAAVYKTFGDSGYDRNAAGRASATLTFRAPATATIAAVLVGRTMYSFILSLGTTEDSDELTLPALDARVTGAPIEVDAGKDEDVVMLEWTAQVSGSFSVTPA